MNKICRKCSASKEVEFFYKDSSKKDGLSGLCKPCDKAGVLERYRKNSEKRKQSFKEYHYQNRETLLSKMKERRKLNLERHKDNCKIWYADNREYALNCVAEYRRINRDIIRERARKSRDENKDHYKDLSRKYRRKYSDRVNARVAKRRYGKMLRTPKWLTFKDFETIYSFYKKAKELSDLTGIKHHVDHIIPLQGKNVSGLHVPWNLQILTAEENLKKNNTFEDIK